MDTIKPANPFVVGRYEGGVYFCDREAEVATLRKHIANGRDISLIAPRRLGKTGLIHHFFAQPDISSRYYTFFIDIYATTSLAELVALLAKAVFDMLKPLGRRITDRFLQVAASLRGAAKYDPTTGSLCLELSVGEIRQPQTTLDEIFRYLEQADRPTIVAIDEFQTIETYDETRTDALLRTKIQACRNTRFIFSGSRQHTMAMMFQSAAKPFYQSTAVMSLKPIPEEVYCPWAARRFADCGKRLPEAVARNIYARYRGYTWYMQVWLNELYWLTPDGGECADELLAEARRNIIGAKADFYREIMARLGTRQKMVLRAIAAECARTGAPVRGITGGAFIRAYGLPSASSVQSALRALTDKDIVSSSGEGYTIADALLAEWLAEE